MVNLATRTHQFEKKTLRLSLAEIAGRSYGDGTTANQTSEVEDQNQKRSLGRPYVKRPANPPRTAANPESRFQHRKS